jgi:hypothetical protein
VVGGDSGFGEDPSLASERQHLGGLGQLAPSLAMMRVVILQRQLPAQQPRHYAIIGSPIQSIPFPRFLAIPTPPQIAIPAGYRIARSPFQHREQGG